MKKKNHEEEKSNYDDKKLTSDSHKEGITPPDGARLRPQLFETLKVV